MSDYICLIASEAKNYKELNILAYFSHRKKCKKWTTWGNFVSNQLQPWIFRIRLRHLIKLGRSPTKWSKRWKVGETSLVASKWKHLHGDWMGKRTNGQSNSWRVASCQQSNMSGSTNFCKRRHNLNLSHLRRWDNKQTPQMPHFLNLTLYFFSNNPYSEPDADNSPNNDTDWDWGGGKASPCGSPGPNLDPDHQNPALTKTVLTGDDNTISKWLNVFCISCQFDLPVALYPQSTQSFST